MQKYTYIRWDHKWYLLVIKSVHVTWVFKEAPRIGSSLKSDCCNARFASSVLSKCKREMNQAKDLLDSQVCPTSKNQALRTV